MSDGTAWVTQREAAELLGVHVSAVPKMVRRGDLTPRAGRPSLSRVAVLELAAARAAAVAEREERQLRPAPIGPRPPNDEHEWLLAPAAAAVLGCTEVAIKGRAARGQVPCTVAGGRRWFRLDLLELLVAARAARERRVVRRVGQR
ncbi:helix-turn-helix domain-containing protein [Nocardioides sp. SYSU D00065]|uniref:helix-turn-helix domain-containing protein n=1 Tax=Nocardioides sp. SYSU D00065 TaxID=2817378 RepID=UPI001B32EFEA|nr:helix-turn-helix domain-containing protein [Nocardioides sp. SYSU D00065]